ncbi:hypothetical protein BD770DRAFT_447545 [Pilaira anomala]|nr:hypothetical protein BD770DRAFT_447545 [Pilaira anomala]
MHNLIKAKLISIVKKETAQRSSKSLLDGSEKLMDPEMMGRIYKILGFAKESGNVKGEPVGFENKK